MAISIVILTAVEIRKAIYYYQLPEPERKRRYIMALLWFRNYDLQEPSDLRSWNFCCPATLKL